MTMIYAIMNQKGGIAKTTTSDALSHEFARKGFKVLTIDLDPQGNLTTGAGVKNQDELEHTVTELLTNTIWTLPTKREDFIIPIVENLDLLPSNIKLANVNEGLTNAERKQYILKDALGAFKDDYDVIVIDCPPSLGNLTVNALTCADRVLIPSSPEMYSAKGLELLITSIFDVKKRFNPGLEIEGILYTRVDPQLKLFRMMKDLVDKAYGKHIHIFPTFIPQSTAVGLSLVENNCSIMFGNKSNPAVEAYKRIADEIIERNALKHKEVRNNA